MRVAMKWSGGDEDRRMLDLASGIEERCGHKDGAGAKRWRTFLEDLERWIEEMKERSGRGNGVLGGQSNW
jgi:hypothetical protein